MEEPRPEEVADAPRPKKLDPRPNFDDGPETEAESAAEGLDMELESKEVVARVPDFQPDEVEGNPMVVADSLEEVTVVGSLYFLVGSMALEEIVSLDAVLL
jgi:hypothetical protein